MAKIDHYYRKMNNKKAADYFKSTGGFVFSSPLKKYITYMRGNKKASQGTLDERERVGIQFDRFLSIIFSDQIKGILDIKPSHIKTFLDDYLLRYNKTSYHYRNCCLTHLEKVFEHIIFHQKSEGLEMNPCSAIPRFNAEIKGSYSAIPNSELHILMEQLRMGKWGLRDYTLSMLIWKMGIEVKQAISLDISDLDMKNRIIHLVQEIKEEGVIKEEIQHEKIPEEMYYLLKDYLEYRKDNFLPANSTALFLGEKGNPYNLRVYENTFKNALVDTDMSIGYKPRSLYASYVKRDNSF